MVTDYYGLKIRKNVINQTVYGLIRTFEEVEVVPIIGTKNEHNILFINNILNFIFGRAPKNAPMHPYSKFF